MSRQGLRVGVSVAAALFLAACVSVRGRPAEGPAEEAQAYLQEWAGGDFGAMGRRVAEPPANFVERHQRFRDELRILSSRFEPGRVELKAESAVVTFRATHVLRGLGEWRVDGSLRLVRREGRWWVRWTPAVLHPELREGDRFSRTRTPIRTRATP